MSWPNFFLIGAAKAGTTALARYLGQHPDVCLSSIKEPRYYDHERAAGLPGVVRDAAAYRALFAHCKDARAIGEASPQYLHSDLAPARIRADVPGARLIVSLRSPVERAYSSYLGRVGAGIESRPVADALQPGSYYVRTSLYADDLRRWIDCFGRDALHVLLFDDLQRDAAAVLRDLFAFLAVDAGFDAGPLARHNEAWTPSAPRLNAVLTGAARLARRWLPGLPRTGLLARAQRPLRRAPDALPDAERVRLQALFERDIEVTATLIGRDLGHWLR